MSKKTVLGILVVVLSLVLLVSLAACRGDTGPAGEQGPQGLKGDTGSQGSQGPAGQSGISTGAIEGKVTATATGKSLEKVTIVTNPVTTTATTDAEGKYKIASVPAGVYYVKATAAGFNAAGGEVSVQATKSATVNMGLATEDPFALAKVRAISFRTNDKEKLADSLRMTTHYQFGDKPSRPQNEDVIVTSGLPNVAAGSFVYLEGKEADGHDKKLTTWEWKVVGPGESAVTVENANTRTPRFKADRMGKYEVAITATNQDGAKASSTLEVFAGSFIGQAACVTCHSGSVMPDVASEFQQSGHATKLIDTYASYAADRDYCIACHTTGYNEADKAGGFDDLAKQAGWDPKKESVTAWLKNGKWTVEQIMNSVMGKLANVQCESCHGPGQLHEGILTAKETTALMEPGVCSQCHPQEAEWRNSGHSNTGSKTMHMAEGASCVECHTGQGFVEVKIRGKKPVFPAQAVEEEPATLAEPSHQAPVACATCHDPHAFSEPFNKGTAEKPNIASLQLRLSGDVAMPNGVTAKASESAVCVSCHANKRDVAYKTDFIAGKKTRGVHGNPQADVFYGAGAFDYGKKFNNSAHTTLVKNGCLDCHMAAKTKAPAGAVADGKEVVSDHGNLVLYTGGGHTWNMNATYQGKEVENLGACTACHKDLTTFNRTAYGDFDGDGKIEGVQDEVTGLLEALAKELPKDAATGAVMSGGFTTTNTTEAQRKALWNYWLVKNDGSNGVHNTRFAVEVLTTTFQELTGKAIGK